MRIATTPLAAAFALAFASLYDEEAAELGSQVVGQIRQVVVGVRDEHGEDRQPGRLHHQAPALVAPDDTRGGRAVHAPALARVLT